MTSVIYAPDDLQRNPPQKVVLDGEIIGTTPIDVECVHGGLTIFVPLNAAPPSPVKNWQDCQT